METRNTVLLSDIENNEPLIFKHLIPMAKRLNWVPKNEDGVDYVTIYAFKLLQKMLSKKVTFKELNGMISEISHCHVCKEALLPDEEAYVVEGGKVACDTHSVMDEISEKYVTVY